MQDDYDKTVIFGATSGIGRALAAELAKQHRPLMLAGRDKIELQRLQADLEIRFSTICEVAVFDLLQKEQIEQCIQSIQGRYPIIDELYFLMGYLGDQKIAEDDWEERDEILNINYTMAVHLLSEFANYFEKRKSGKIIIVGSVAGDRGRRSNYLYGSAKAGLHAFAQGLRNRMAKHNVHVMTVKPGFVDTAMTFGLPGLYLVASPRQVAKRIIKSASRNKNEIYVPFFWRYVMWIVRNIPEFLFKKLPL